MSLALISNVAGTGSVFAGRHHDRYPSSPDSLLISPRASRSATHVARARKGLSRSRRLDNRDKKDGSGVATANEAATPQELVGERIAYPESVGGGVEGFELSNTPMPWEQEKGFWEGPQWDAFGFFLQYMWAFGVGFALIACGIAAGTYNDGATDFRQTPVYKDSIQSQELLEEPDASNTDVFEANPTEVAPSLE
ncbi:hypothetical protein Cni_G22855 [Canna indica]|uniref:Uncharacterized protein n=1 Tax=Canna indica TaxID=4628 RepID=A0AAQ3KTC5_9LILI|nr:hypothetical protein Cni_G22855 [Canna indica]